MNSNGYIEQGCLHPFIVYKDTPLDEIKTYCGKKIPSTQKLKENENVGVRQICLKCGTEGNAQLSLLPWQVKEYFYE